QGRGLPRRRGRRGARRDPRGPVLRPEKTVAHEFAGGNERAMKAGVRAKKLAAGLERATDVLVGIAQGTVLVVGSLQVLRGAMSPGDMVLFLTYLKIAMK